MNKLYKLKNLDELMQQIDMGLDIEFYLRNIRYNISWRNEKPFICACPDGEAITYDSPEKMFDDHVIDGKPLKELWNEFEILFM